MNLAELLTGTDRNALLNYGISSGRLESPDLVITDDHEQPYLFRWHVIPRNPNANIYLHVQVSSDPERPLHDHPWDNQSVILSGGYDEQVKTSFMHKPELRAVRKGMVVHRHAEEAHRLILPDAIPYTITQFTTGAYRRAWGFWIAGKWYDHKECQAEIRPGVVVFKWPEGTSQEVHEAHTYKVDVV